MQELYQNRPDLNDVYVLVHASYGQTQCIELQPATIATYQDRLRPEEVEEFIRDTTCLNSHKESDSHGASGRIYAKYDPELYDKWLGKISKICSVAASTDLHLKPHQADPVNPDHYKVGGIEVWDILKAKLTPEQLEGFCLGNILKYTMRANHKNGLEDLKKSQWHLEHLIEEKEKGCRQPSKK